MPMTVAKMRRMIDTIEAAQKRAKVLLAHEPTTEEKLAFFDKIYPICREYLQLMVEDGRTNHHVCDAFQPRCLRAAFGDDFHQLDYELGSGN